MSISGYAMSSEQRPRFIRNIIVLAAVVWITAGCALMWKPTASCLETFNEFGWPTSLGSCLPLAGLVLFVWSAIGAAVGLVLLYWIRGRGATN
jgi:hypothetical protein